MAGGEGFEPSQSEPESDVLPLDDPPTTMSLIQDWNAVKIGNKRYATLTLKSFTFQALPPSPCPLPSWEREQEYKKMGVGLSFSMRVRRLRGCVGGYGPSLIGP